MFTKVRTIWWQAWYRAHLHHKRDSENEMKRALDHLLECYSGDYARLGEFLINTDTRHVVRNSQS